MATGIGVLGGVASGTVKESLGGVGDGVDVCRVCGVEVAPGVPGDGTAGEAVGVVSNVADGVGVSLNVNVASGNTVAPGVVGGTEVGIGVSTEVTGVSTEVTGGVGVLIGSPPQPIRKTMKAALKRGQ